MTVQSTLSAKLHSEVSGVGDFGNPSASIDISFTKSFANGVAAGQANILFADTRTLAASANESLDLSGALLDAIGQAAVFAKVKALMIRAAEANTNDVIVGAAASTPFLGPLGGTTPTITLKPGAFFIMSYPGAGWVVTNSSNDLLKIANSAGGTGVDYDIAILGTNA